jgi:hypothetical protein
MAASGVKAVATATTWAVDGLLRFLGLSEIATIVDLPSPEACDDHVRFSESFGYRDAPITTALGPVMAKDVRNNDRALLDDPQRAAELWQRVCPSCWLQIPSGHRSRYGSDHERSRSLPGRSRR